MISNQYTNVHTSLNLDELDHLMLTRLRAWCLAASEIT